MSINASPSGIHHDSLSTSYGFFRTSHASCCCCLCISNPGFKPIPNYTTTAACNDAATTLDSLCFNPPSLPISIIALSSTSSIFTLKFPLLTPSPELDFHVYVALWALLDEIVFMHALAKQEDDGIVTVHSFVNRERRAFDAQFREWAPEVTGCSRSLPMASPSTSTPTLGR